VCVDQLLNWLNRIGVLLTVGDDTVCSTVKCILAHCSHCFLKLMPGSKRLTVDQTELVGSITGVRVTVGRARLTVSSPSSVSHRSLSDKSLGHVDDSDVGRLLSVRSSSLVGRLVGIGSVLGDQLTETGDLSDLLEEDGRGVGSVTVDTDTFRLPRFS
jgi:hypothetical protein